MTLQAPPTLDLPELNTMFERATPQKIVEWAIAQWGDDVVTTSSFGAESALMIHLATQAKPDIKIIMVDTGFLFPETIADAWPDPACRRSASLARARKDQLRHRHDPRHH